MILSDGGIDDAVRDGRLTIDPYDPNALQPSSYDVRLGNTFINRKSNDKRTVYEGDRYLLFPQELVLADTLEWFKFGNQLAGRIEGKSSLGRDGMLVHISAGWVDAGFKGTLTLELYSVSNKPIELYPGMYIAQIAFFPLDKPARRPYGSKGLGSKYQGQRGPTPSRSS